MRKCLLVAFLLSCIVALHAQYNNEWIDYQKTYYKFKIGATGLYRINQPALQAEGLGAVSAEQFQLWRNGKEVSLYTSVATGALPANGYIEFWGEQNDGKPDKPLYKNQANQLSDKLSLETDTAAYFLTVNAGINLRVNDAVNDVTNNTLPPEKYFMHDYRVDFKTLINRGRAVNFGEYVYSSTYDVGEFWSSGELNPGSSIDNTSDSLFVAANGPNAVLNVSFAGNSYLGTNRKVQVSINGTPYISQPLSIMDAKIFSKNVPLSAFNNNIASFKIQNINATQQNDRIVVGFIDLQYPRLFNFGGAANFSFQLPASLQGNYIEIKNFNGGSSTPVLYDITNNKRYAAVSAGAIYKFALQPSPLDRTLVLVSEEAVNITLVNNFTKRSFINFSSSANQGDYLIISNKLLFNTGTAIEEYRQYRASSTGGSYNAKIYDIDELADQFAFGIKKHPLSIKNFLSYARQKFSVEPKFIFLIGKAVTYDEYRLNESSRFAEQLNLVPTFGWPASDNILASDGLDPIPETPVGRLAIISNEEVKEYLQKIKLYEQQQASNTQTIADKAWMKNVIHVTGANNTEGLEAELVGYLKSYENIIEDSLFGGNVFTFSRTTTGPQTQATDALMQQLFNGGLSLINYFGHSSASFLDYKLNDPDAFNNYGKYPVFIANGCNAGNFYAFDTSRLSYVSSIAEKFVLAKDKGAVGFIGSTHFGVTDYLDAYNAGFYKSLTVKNYDRAVTYSMIEGERNLLSFGFDSTTKYLHAEETVLNGDPALKINAQAKPDFVIEEPQVIVSPAFISVADSSFNAKAYFHNIGKATGDSVSILVKRQRPDGSLETLVSKRIVSVQYEDSILLSLPIVASSDKGENKLIVSIDDLSQYDELSETNNIVTKTFFIYEDELKQIHPYNFAIVNKSNIKLVTSTANPVSPLRQYAMEIDTTELFNSSLKVSRNISSVGGVVEFDPGISFTDSTVYYWRAAAVPATGAYHWNTSSFIYLSNSSFGYNQSHLYQHLKSGTERVYLDSFSRQWNFKDRITSLQIYNSIFPFYTHDADFQVQISGTTVTAAACLGHSVIFNVFDPVTLKPFYNQALPSITGSGNYGGFLGSAFPCGKQGSEYNFEFTYLDTTGRRKMRNFMDWVPAGALVTARLILDAPYDQILVDTWKNDAQVYGAGNTLYQRFKNAGFSDIDSFTYPRTWVFIYKKNTPSFAPMQKLSVGLADNVNLSANINSPDTLGFVTSPVFGPAKAWKQVKWRGKTSDASAGDKSTVDVIGVNATGQEQLLYTLSSTQQDFDISTISPVTYPNLKLRMRNADSIHFTPYQLKYWRILYDPVPEGALAANITYNFKDTLELGQKLEASIAFKNVSDVVFADSIKVNLTISDKNNLATAIQISRLKALAPQDTAVIKFIVDTKDFVGNNTLFLDVNPGNDQPEQYHANNFLYKTLFVKGDNYKPLLDVTFDGVHILNNDIVSSKPNVLIKLKDESKFLLLDDTSLLNVQLKYPDGSMRRFTFNSDTLHFNPATPGSAENVASVDFTPFLTDDGEYQLFVTGKDKTGNTAGNTEYRVSFQVYNKPMISNMFNYPNPFTTSTAFVFTITGSQVPQNIRIQILTITGKIVKDITSSELGSLHIGRNITEYKWDGTDQYGQKLANGVYIYRVLTNLNGKSLDKFNIIDADGNRVDTDKYFNKGYGKMYLMR